MSFPCDAVRSQVSEINRAYSSLYVRLIIIFNWRHINYLHFKLIVLAFDKRGEKNNVKAESNAVKREEMTKKNAHTHEHSMVAALQPQRVRK